MTRDGPVSIKAVETSFRILDELRRTNGAGTRELANRLSMAKSTVNDHLQTLEQLGYVLNEQGTYRSGMRFLELGGQARKQMKIYQIAKSEIRQLATETGDHANLMIEENGWGIFLYKSEAEGSVQLDTYAGMRVHLHTSALGKSMMAFMDSDHRQSIIDARGLPSVTDNTVSTQEALMDELSVVRDRGYAVDDEERVKGMRCVAAPILNTSGTVLGSVSVSSPKSRLQGERFESTIPDRVIGAANRIEVNFSYS